MAFKFPATFKVRWISLRSLSFCHSRVTVFFVLFINVEVNLQVWKRIKCSENCKTVNTHLKKEILCTKWAIHKNVLSKINLLFIRIWIGIFYCRQLCQILHFHVEHLKRKYLNQACNTQLQTDETLF